MLGIVDISCSREASFSVRVRRSATAFVALRAVLTMTVVVGCGAATSGPTQEPRPGSEYDVLSPEPATLPATEAAGRAPTVRERGLVEDLAADAQRVRELRFVGPVGVIVQSRALIREHFGARLARPDFERRRRVYVGLGMLDPTVDVRRVVLDVFCQQVIGYFEYRRAYLAVRDDVMGELRSGSDSAIDGDGARLVLVHELVHALQAQHFPALDPYGENLTIDAQLARQALVEGDASLAMLGEAARGSNRSLREITADLPELRRILATSARELSGGAADTPPAVRIPLEYAYLDGVLFAAELFARGGWERLNAAYAAPPLSSEQILHPAEYLRGGRPLAIEMTVKSGLARVGWVVEAEDTLGELMIGVFLGAGAVSGVTRAAAVGWAGDRVLDLRNANGQHGVVWWTAWHSEADAERVLALAERVAGSQSAEASIHAARSGRGVLIARGIAAELAPLVSTSFEEWAATL